MDKTSDCKFGLSGRFNLAFGDHCTGSLETVYIGPRYHEGFELAADETLLKVLREELTVLV